MSNSKLIQTDYNGKLKCQKNDVIEISNKSRKLWNININAKKIKERMH